MPQWTDHNDKFINEQLDLLLAHRDITVRTLKKIKEREIAIQQVDLITKAASLALIKSYKKPLKNIQKISPENGTKPLHVNFL